jgi:hypothetical protein
MIKPKLIDPNWFVQKKPVIVKAKPKLNFKISDYINFISVTVLIILILFLYDRYQKRALMELEKQNTILQFHQTVKEKLEK